LQQVCVENISNTTENKGYKENNRITLKIPWLI
jgi:hypothetical protein